MNNLIANGTLLIPEYSRFKDIDFVEKSVKLSAAVEIIRTDELSRFRIRKTGCAFLMVILSKFLMGQYRTMTIGKTHPTLLILLPIL